MEIRVNKHAVCFSADCPHQKMCANHESAGEFREEDGFSPQFLGYDSGKMIAECATADEKNLDNRDLGMGFIDFQGKKQNRYCD